MAKKTKLTPELSAKFCEAIAKGHSLEGACGAVGITFQTYRNWYVKGENAKSGKFKQFKCDVDAAKDKATHLVEGIVIESMVNNPNDAKWWLTKRRFNIYGDRTFNETKIDADVKTEVLAKLERPLPELKDDE